MDEKKVRISMRVLPSDKAIFYRLREKYYQGETVGNVWGKIIKYFKKNINKRG